MIYSVKFLFKGVVIKYLSWGGGGGYLGGVCNKNMILRRGLKQTAPKLRGYETKNYVKKSCVSHHLMILLQ